MKKPFAISVALVLLVSSLCFATTVERLDLDKLVTKSNNIIMGKVLSSRTYWSANGKIILTSYTIEVQENIKGQAPRNVELTTIGGKIGDVELHVAGMPSFDNGEAAVVFLENSGAFRLVVGLGQGKFSVTNNEVSNDVSGLAFPDGRPAKNMKMSLETFKNQIRALVRR